MDWANESYLIAISPAADYCVKANDKCQYEAGNETLDKGEERKTVKVDEAYITKNGPTAAQQLTKAGVRLGKMIDDLLGKE